MNLSALKDLHIVDSDAALDVAYATVDDLAREGRWHHIDAILIDPEVLTLPTDLILGFLTASRPWRFTVPNRASLMEAAREVFDQRGEDTNDLLRHL